MTLIALKIFGYWLSMAMGMWLLMYSALWFARACECAVDHFTS